MIDCEECLDVALAQVYQFIREHQRERREGAFLAELPSRRGQVSELETLDIDGTLEVSKRQGGPALEALTHP